MKRMENIYDTQLYGRPDDFRNIFNRYSWSSTREAITRIDSNTRLNLNQKKFNKH